MFSFEPIEEIETAKYMETTNCAETYRPMMGNLYNTTTTATTTNATVTLGPWTVQLALDADQNLCFKAIDNDRNNIFSRKIPKLVRLHFYFESFLSPNP